MEKTEQRKERIRRRPAESVVLGSELWIDGVVDRRKIWKMGELWRHAFDPKEAVKNRWEMCEDCWEIRRRRGGKGSCGDGHLVWTTEKLKETYSLKNSKDLMVILNMIRKERTQDGDEVFQLPRIPRHKKKTKKRMGKKPEQKTPEKSRSQESGEDEETRD